MTIREKAAIETMLAHWEADMAAEAKAGAYKAAARAEAAEAATVRRQLAAIRSAEAHAAKRMQDDQRQCFVEPTRERAEARLTGELTHCRTLRAFQRKQAAAKVDQLPNGQWRVRV